MAVYRALMEAQGHPSADDIFNDVKHEFPNISFDTVYRALMTFSEIGIIDTVEGHGAPKRFDVNPDGHHHFYCIGCGRIIDFYSEAMDQAKIPSEIKRKCRILGRRMVLKGYCDECRKRMRGK